MRRAILGAIFFFYICIVSGQERNYIQVAHTLNDLIRYRDQKTEDSFYFRNSARIDSLLDDRQTPAELSTLLHLMQARRLVAFTDRYLKFNRARYETPDLHYNYAAMSNEDLDSVIRWHFASVKKGLYPLLKAAAPEEINWLSSNPGIFLFNPSLWDILMAEEIGYQGKKRPLPNMTGQKAREWLKYTPDRFIVLLDSLRAYPGNALAGYGEWLSGERSNPHACGFIETLARKHLYQRFPGDTSIDNTYESYLLARTKESITEVKAYAVYQLCLIWNSKANIREDSTYTPARALRLYEDNKGLFHDYADLRNVLETMRAKILSANLQAGMEQASIPGEPVLLQLLYKNTPHIWYRIIRRYQDDTLPGKRLDMLEFLLHKPAVREVDVELPLPADHASHRTSLKIDPLPPGEYDLLFADHPIGQETDHLGRLACSVSRMALLSSDGRVDVLDRKTGQPLPGVKLQHRGDHIRAIMQTDTLDDKADATEDEIRNGYDPDEDTPMEYYVDKGSVAIFTDRSIYRPGQKVFFKAIVLTKDLHTGRRILFNKAGINRGMFSRRLQKWLREEKPVLVVEDPFYRGMDTIPVRPNAYGSFSGSFRIPDHAATGEWRITSEDMDKESNEGIFHVEEYKRPRFECKVQKPEKTFLPGEPVSFTLRVRTLTGAAPGNTRIKYTIERSGDLLLDSSGVTDDRGLLTVTIRDTDLLRTPIVDSVPWTGNYALEATATDLTGESHEVTSSLEVSSRPVRIKLRVETACSKDHWEPLLVTTVDPNGLSLSKDLQVIVYRLNGRDREQMVYETRLNTGTGEKLTLPVANWQTGVYRIKVSCRENGRLMGETSVQWKLFDLHSNQWSFEEPSFFYLPYNSVRAGDTLRFFAGTAFDSSYVLMQLKYYSTRYKRLRSVALFRNAHHASGVYREQWRMPEDATGNALLTWLTIRDNKVYREQHTIAISRKQDEPRIIVEQFRDRLMPGEKAHFTVSVKTRDQSVAAELLSTIYDASLDLLQTHTWDVPWERPLERPEMGWPRRLTEMSTDVFFRLLSTPDPGRFDDMTGFLQGSVAGLSITNATGYEDVVVVGYGTTRRSLSASTIMIRGSSSWPAINKQVLIILDGVPYTGDLKNLDIRSITDGIVLEGADATSIYGSRAANGVLVLSTKGKLVLPQAPEDPPVKVRSRFDETAYFAPALYADKEGYYHFVFTLPESVTEWNWKILALTKKAQFAYAERKFQTRLPLMIQPQLPRFFCQGDQVTILSRISNLDSGRLSGKVTCRVEDATTGEDLSAQLIRQAPSDFALSSHSVTTAATILKIPQGQLHPVRLIFKASTHEFSDGEAQVLPVISTRILLSRHQSFSLNGADTVLSLSSLPAGDSLAGIGLSLDVPPQNAFINALPWLAGYSYDCAEQTFNKLLAECTALDVFRKDTALHRTYDYWARKTASERDTVVTPPDMPAEKMTPWEDLTGRGKRQTQELIALFDTVGGRGRIEAHLERLYSLQKPDGGLSWFDGGSSNYYISGYVLAGFGKLRDLRRQFPSSATDRLDLFLEKLLRYGDDQFLSQQDLWYAYARQYWLKKYPPSDRLRDAVRKLLGSEWQQGNGSLRMRALRIIISAAWLDGADPLYIKGQNDLQRLYEEAIVDKQNGLRWKEIADDDDLDCSAEETLALLTEAFQHASRASEVRLGILQWLLRNRADHHWTSTKATAAVIGLLGQTGKDPVGAPHRLSMVNGADTIHVSDEIMAGRQFAFIPTNSLPRGVTMRKSDTGAVSGHLGLYYFGSSGDANDSQSFVHLSKLLYVYNDSSRKWAPVKEDRPLHVGDKVKTVLVLATTRPLHFLYIRDQTAAAMEPAEVHSDYDYEGGLSFYNSIRDTGGQFFFDMVPSGKWEISYESRISHAGSFTGGPASLECMYRPEIHAYSETIRVVIN